MFFLGFTASAAFHLYSSIVSARQHSPCPRIELLENIQRDVCRRTGNCTGHLQPTGPTTPKSSEFWARVHCRTILTQTVFIGYPQCITGPKRPRQFSTAGLSSAVPPGMSETCWCRKISLRMHFTFCTNVYSNLHDFTTTACSEFPAIVSQGPKDIHQNSRHGDIILSFMYIWRRWYDSNIYKSSSLRTVP